MSLVEKLPSRDYLHDKQAQGLVRASVNVLSGVYEGISFSSPAMLRSGGVCDPGTACYDLYEILTGHISMLPPMKNIVFAPMQIAYGSQRAWAEVVREVASSVGDGAYVAAAHAFGRDYNAVVEVMAEDVDELHRILLAVTDVAGVQRVDIHRARPEDTQGMGTPAT